jgi:transcriptional regulator with XRE-family HTH domain
MKDLGNKPVMAFNIKRFMREKGINAKELSKAIGVPYTTVLSWIKAEYYPRIDKIERMSEYFDCLKSDLIEDKTKEKPAAGDGDELSENKQALMKLVQNCSEEDAGRLLQIMQLFLENAKQDS